MERGGSYGLLSLGYDTVAASNMPTAEQIHSMLDRHRAAASPFAGSSLLAARYRDVPLLSSAWAIGHIGLPFSDRGRISVLGLQLPLPEDTTFVASLRYVGAVHLRIEQIAPTEQAAAEATRSLGALLALFKSMEHIRPEVPGDVAMGQVIDSLKIEQHKDRAVLTGTIPVELLQQMTVPGPSAQP